MALRLLSSVSGRSLTSGNARYSSSSARAASQFSATSGRSRPADQNIWPKVAMFAGSRGAPGIPFSTSSHSL